MFDMRWPWDSPRSLCANCRFNEDRSPFIQRVKEIVFGTDFEITRHSS
jgi:hypothetical protein